MRLAFYLRKETRVSYDIHVYAMTAKSTVMDFSIFIPIFVARLLYND